MIVDGEYLDSGCRNHRSIPELEGDTVRLSSGSYLFPRVSDRRRHHQLHFRARGLTAPDAQFRTNSTGTLTHSGQTPVAGLTLGPHRVIDSHPIISNSYAKRRRIVREFDLYLRSRSVPKRVCQCLAGNVVRFVLYGRLENLRSSDDFQGEARRMILCQLFSTLGQPFSELVFIGRSAAKVSNALPCFAQDFIGAVEHAIDHLSERILRRHVLGHTLHTQCDALEPLQEGIVQLTCDALSLLHLRLATHVQSTL